MVPDSAIELTGLSVHRSDRAKELTGKSRGGGVCFYINNLWCDERNLHSIKSFCSPDLEFHTLLCRPFWLPREFTAIIIMAVYIPPQANTDQALRELYGNISEQEQCHESGCHSLQLHITHGLHLPSCTAHTLSRPPLHQSHSCHHSLINSDCLTTPAPHSLTHIKAAHKHSPSAKSCFPLANISERFSLVCLPVYYLDR